MKTIDLTALSTVSGGIAETASNRPGPSQWNLPTPQQWNLPQPKPSAPPTQPLGPWTPSKPWA